MSKLVLFYKDFLYINIIMFVLTVYDIFFLLKVKN